MSVGLSDVLLYLFLIVAMVLMVVATRDHGYTVTVVDNRPTPTVTSVDLGDGFGQPNP